MAMRIIQQILPKSHCQTHIQQKYLELPNESLIFFKSADNPDSLVGEGVHLAIMDEAARMSFEAFQNIRTTLTATRGNMYVISTPRGRNWFYDLWLKGKKEHSTYDPDYRSWNLPTSDNPYISPDAIEQARRLLPEDVFREFYLAEFLEEGSVVFRNYRNCIADTLGPYNRDAPGLFVAGIDLAKENDFSVIMIIEASTSEIVFVDRFRRLSWPLQVERITKILTEYRVRETVIDATGVGDAVNDFLTEQYKGIVHPYKISGIEAKKQIIQNLQVLFERGQIKIPKLEWLIKELEHYEYQVTKTGKYTYNAPEGQHDDGVIALALAAWGARPYKGFKRDVGYDPGRDQALDDHQKLLHRLKGYA